MGVAMHVQLLSGDINKSLAFIGQGLFFALQF
jgi:hypothetical protein